MGTVEHNTVKMQKACHSWLQGTCSYGEKCKFLHPWSLGVGFSLSTQLEGHQNLVTAIALPSGSNILFTGSKDEIVRLRDCQSHQCSGAIDVGGEVGCMITEGSWIFVGMPNLVKWYFCRRGICNIVLNGLFRGQLAKFTLWLWGMIRSLLARRFGVLIPCSVSRHFVNIIQLSCLLFVGSRIFCHVHWIKQ